MYVKNFPFSARKVGRSYKCALGFSFLLNSFGLNTYANKYSLFYSQNSGKDVIVPYAFGYKY